MMGLSFTSSILGKFAGLARLIADQCEAKGAVRSVDERRGMDAPPEFVDLLSQVVERVLVGQFDGLRDRPVDDLP